MNPVQINNVDHADLRVSPSAGAAYGDAVNQALVFPAEFEELQREFPIIFRRRESGIQAYALLGLDRDENLYLSGSRWTSRYVPATHQRGPFSIGMAAGDGQDEPEPMILLDMDDPRVGHADGIPVFLQHGGNSPYLNRISAVLRLLLKQTRTAPAAYAAFEQAGLLSEVTLSIDVSDDRRYTVPDVLIVDMERLAAIKGEALDRLYGSGLLRLAILASASLGNIQQLIARKQALLYPSG